MKIQEIKIEKFPVVVITDSHCNINNIRILKELYPNSLFVCLGDITNLFAKEGEPFNKLSINYFIKENIPSCLGNHDQYILATETSKDLPKVQILGKTGLSFGLKKEQIDYLSNLPNGIKLILPDGNNYLCFHHLPLDIWGFKGPNDLTENVFKNVYPIDNRTVAVLHGHLHENFIVNFPNIKTKRICVGRLTQDGNYGLITEKGFEFKKV